MMSPVWITLGSISAFLAVAAGAFAAHGLSEVLDERATEVFQTAVRYQLFHALALLIVGILDQRRRAMQFEIAGWCFTAGTILFSGSLYILAISGFQWMGAVTPLGGVAFLLGWAVMIWHGLANQSRSRY